MKISLRKWIGLVSVILLAFIIYFYYVNTGQREIVFDEDVTASKNVKDFHLSTNGIMIFDNNLYILNKDAELIKTVTSKDAELTAFFANNYGFLYDEDLGKIRQYQDTGEFIRTIKLTDKLYNIKYENKNLIFHTKYENGEKLWSLGLDGKLVKIYETPNTILTYDVHDNNNFAVSELKVESNGYTTTCIVKKSSENKTYNQSSEVALALDFSADKTIMVTNKNLYTFDNDEVNKVEIPNISDALVIDRNIYLLHSGILSKYNFNLQETEKHIVAANIERIQQVAKSLYGYSNSDLAGNLLQRNEYYFRFPSEVDKIEISGIRIGTLKNGVVSIYKVTNKRNEIGELSK